MTLTKTAVITRLNDLGTEEIKIRRSIGILQDEIKELKKELKKIEKETFSIRSSKEYEEIYHQ